MSIGTVWRRIGDNKTVKVKKIQDGHGSEIQQYFTHLGPDLKTVTACKAKLLTVQRSFSNKNLKILTQ